MRVGWLALALAVLGCDGIGDPVVDMRPSGARRGPEVCERVDVHCELPFHSQAPFPAATAVVPAHWCGALSTDACGDTPRGGGCVLALRVDPTPVELPLQTCATIDLMSAPDNERAELRGLVARASRIVLHAQRPTTFVFSQVDLSDVAIEMAGPVSFQVDGTLRNVSVASADDVQVTITTTTAEKLIASLPRGSLRIQRSTVTKSKLAVRDANLETDAVSDLELTAERLVGIELRGENLRLDVGDLSLSEVEANVLELHRCETALLVNMRLSRAQFAACSERLRVHSSVIATGRAQGLIESASTFWGDMHFGAGNMDTTLETWSGYVVRSVLCPNLRRLTVSQLTATCNDCTRLAVPERHICRVVDDTNMATPSAGFPMGVDNTGGLDPDAGPVDGYNAHCPLLDQGPPRCDPTPARTSPL